MISMYRPALVLFPRLLGIKLWPVWLGESDYPAVLGLIGSHVKEVSIQWNLDDDPERHLQTCISLISARFSSVEDFDLYCSKGPRVCKIIHASLIDRLRSLRNFRSNKLPISRDALGALGRLQNLSAMNIHLPAFLETPPLDSGSFPALGEIEITALTMDYFAFADAVGTLPRVERADIVLRDAPKPEDGLRFFDSICTKFSHTKLTQLSVSTSEDAHSLRETPPALITHPHLRRLFGFTALIGLTVNLACSYALDGDLCLEIAKAFPEMEVLHIGDSKVCRYDYPTITVPPMSKVLCPFATHCRELISLGIPFDARESFSIQDVKDALPYSPSRSQLYSLHCSHSPIEDGQLVAAYLARVFPALANGYDIWWCEFGRSYLGREWESEWEEVRRLVPWFKMIRDDEANLSEDSEG